MSEDIIGTLENSLREVRRYASSGLPLKDLKRAPTLHSWALRRGSKGDIYLAGNLDAGREVIPTDPVVLLLLEEEAVLTQSGWLRLGQCCVDLDNPTTPLASAIFHVASWSPKRQIMMLETTIDHYRGLQRREEQGMRRAI